jgi:hypothetical protein
MSLIVVAIDFGRMKAIVAQGVFNIVNDLQGQQKPKIWGERLRSLHGNSPLSFIS